MSLLRNSLNVLYMNLFFPTTDYGERGCASVLVKLTKSVEQTLTY